MTRSFAGMVLVDLPSTQEPLFKSTPSGHLVLSQVSRCSTRGLSPGSVSAGLLWFWTRAKYLGHLQMAWLSFLSSSMAFRKVEKRSAFGGRSWRKGEQTAALLKTIAVCEPASMNISQDARMEDFLRNVRFSRPSIKTPEQSGLSTID